MERIPVEGFTLEALQDEIRRAQPERVELDSHRVVEFVRVAEFAGKTVVIYKDGLHDPGQGAVEGEREDAMVPLAKVVALFR